MFKRISAFIIASAMLVSMTACSMPQNIFSDEIGTSSDDGSQTYERELFDFEFTMDDRNYFLPADYSHFVEEGWSLETVVAEDGETDGKAQTDSQTVELAAGQYSDYYYAVNEGYRIGLKFYNDNDKTVPLESCKVVGISMDALGQSVPFTRILESIEFGSSYDEVVALCGEPSYIKTVSAETGTLIAINDIVFSDTEESTVDKAYYYVDEHTFVEFTFGIYDKEIDCIVNMVIENNVAPETEYKYENDRKKAPDVIQLYTAPALLGKALDEFSFKYEDNLYTLPIPVSELIDDGWEFVRGASMKVQRGTTEDGVVLRKSNLFIEILVHNYDTKKVQTPINCYAVSLSAGATGPFANVMMPKGISLGSDASDVETYYGISADADQEDEKNDAKEEEDTTSQYAVSNDKSFVELKETDDYVKYSYVMPDDVPTVELPVSITDIGDINTKLLGTYRKRIEIYVSKANNKVVHIYMQNCPEYVVDEEALWIEQLERADKEQNQ